MRKQNIYIVTDKQTNKAEPIGSLATVATHTDTNINSLYYQFSTLKKSEFEIKNHLIEKKQLIVSERVKK